MDDRTEESIYLFETRTGKMIKRIAGLPNVTHSLAFSPDGRYLAAGLGGRKVCAFLTVTGNGPRSSATRTMATVIYGLTFAADGRLATASYDGMVRLYDRDFKLVVPPRKAPGGNQPFRIAFSPDGAMLAVGYEDAATVDLFDGHSLAPLPGPNVDGLGNGNLSASHVVEGRQDPLRGRELSTMDMAAPSWPGPMRVGASGALCRPGTIQSAALRRCRMAASWLRRRTRS